jgi:hypothetical protein
MILTEPRKGRVEAIRDLLEDLQASADLLDTVSEERGQRAALAAVVEFLVAIAPDKGRLRDPFRLLLMDMTAEAEGVDKHYRLWAAQAEIVAAMDVMIAHGTSPEAAADLARQAAEGNGVQVGTARSIEELTDEEPAKKAANEYLKNLLGNFKKAKTISQNSGKRRVPERIYHDYLRRVEMLESAVVGFSSFEVAPTLAVHLDKSLKRYRPKSG